MTSSQLDTSDLPSHSQDTSGPGRASTSGLSEEVLMRNQEMEYKEEYLDSKGTDGQSGCAAAKPGTNDDCDRLVQQQSEGFAHLPRCAVIEKERGIGSSEQGEKVEIIPA